MLSGRHPQPAGRRGGAPAALGAGCLLAGRQPVSTWIKLRQAVVRRRICISLRLSNVRAPARQPLGLRRNGGERALPRSPFQAKCPVERTTLTLIQKLCELRAVVAVQQGESLVGAWAKGLLVVASLAFAAAPAVAQITLPGSSPAPAPGPAPGPSPQSAPAGGLITKITPQQVAQLISGAVSGVTLQPQITAQNDGTSLVSFPAWGTQVYSAVDVENCEKDGSGCYALDFFANFGKQPTITQSWMDNWNNQFFAVRVFPLSDGEIVFSADCMVLTGVTPAYITAFAGFFKQVVDQSASYKPATQ
jgi:hypothetical protein